MFLIVTILFFIAAGMIKNTWGKSLLQNIVAGLAVALLIGIYTELRNIRIGFEVHEVKIESTQRKNEEQDRRISVIEAVFIRPQDISIHKPRYR